MNKTINIALVGVGGQGILLASEVISYAAMLSGADAKKSEVHGMAQRGGVVSSHVRFGRRVASPLLPLGSADVLLAFEWGEALRWLPYLKPDATLVASVDVIMPPVACSDRRAWNSRYPAEEPAALHDWVGELRLVEARRIAGELGNAKAASSVLLGALSTLLDVPVEIWERAIRRSVPAKALDVNLACFQAGRGLVVADGRPLAPVPAPREPRVPPRIEITRAWCKGCDICIRFCPEHCLALDAEEKVVVTAPDACTGCRLCELLCPDFAIAIRPQEEAVVHV